MHASIEQLLRLRDGADADSTPGAHVRECATCRLALERLNTLTSALRNLPDDSSPPDRWSAISAKLSDAPVAGAAPRSRPGWLVPAASAALVLLAALFTLGDGDRSDPASGPGSASARADAPHLRLVAESQRLESLLAALPAEPRLTRAHTALTVADLEDRLRWVDYRLNLAREAGLASDDATPLWRERVDLLNSLVAVRYAQVRTVAF